MKKYFLFFFSIFVLVSCSSYAPEPKSWKHDLDGLPEEPINQNIEKLHQELNNPNVWGK